MNLKLISFMAVSVFSLGLSAVNASGGLPESSENNPSARSYAAFYNSPEQRVRRICQSPNVPDFLFDRFINTFNQSLQATGTRWSDLNDNQINTYLDKFLRTGNL